MPLTAPAAGTLPVSMRFRSLLLTLAPALAMVAGCASSGAAGPGAVPIASRDEWASPLHRDHPLAGRVWTVREGRWVDEAALAADLARADFVLLGEIHDNPDHHLLQARLVAALAATGRQPAVAFEMLETTQQRALDAAQVGRQLDADRVAAAVDWEHGGWPDFSLYRPIFAAGLRAGLPLLAANLPRRDVDNFFKVGGNAFSSGVREILRRAGSLPHGSARAMAEEMRQAHCGQLPEELIAPIVQIQRARDAQMAARLLSADRELQAAGYEQGAVLIAGLGHVRVDRAVPSYLAREAPARSVRSVAFLEVSPDRLTPEDYRPAFGGGPLPFDYVVFTPAVPRPDPCGGLRRRAPAPPGGTLTARAD